MQVRNLTDRLRTPRARKGLLACLVLWVVYLVGVNLFINSDLLPRLAAPHPERTKITWERAWTVAPGLIHVRSFKLRSHTRGTVWTLEVDTGRAFFNVFALPFRTVHIVAPRARGIDFVLGTADTVLPRKMKTKPGMKIRINFARAVGIRTMKIGEMAIEGSVRAGGNFSTRARGPLRMKGASLKVDSGTIRYGEETLATGLRINGRASIDRFVPSEHRGESLLPFLVARIRVGGEIADLSFLDALLQNTKSVSFSGGSGRLDADLRLTRGVVEPKSRLVTEEATITVDYLGYRAEGTGRILGFSAADTTVHELLNIHLESYSLAVRGEESPYLEGKDLVVSVRGDEGLQLAEKGLQSDVIIDMPETQVPDMTVYNRDLPSKGGIRIVSGKGRIQSHVEILERTGGGSAEAHLVAEGLVIEIEDKEMVGDLEATGRVKIVDLDKKVFDPSGTRVELRNAGAYIGDADGETPEWWGVVEIPEGRITLAHPPSGEADFTIEAESAAPVFALFAKTQKKADKLDRRLNTEDLSGVGHVRLGEGLIALTGLEVDGGKAQVRADLCIHRGELHGLVHAKYGILAVAAELHDKKETLHITSPKKWFERNRESFTCGQ
ncbi:hypothetical protein N9980_01110 [bacterium]|nr:hypothetical protein [bacterium]